MKRRISLPLALKYGCLCICWPTRLSIVSFTNIRNISFQVVVLSLNPSSRNKPTNRSWFLKWARSWKQGPRYHAFRDGHLCCHGPGPNSVHVSSIVTVSIVIWTWTLSTHVLEELTVHSALLERLLSWLYFNDSIDTGIPLQFIGFDCRYAIVY